MAEMNFMQNFNKLKPKAFFSLFLELTEPSDKLKYSLLSRSVYDRIG